MSERTVTLEIFHGRLRLEIPQSWVGQHTDKIGYALFPNEIRILFPNGQAFGIRLGRDKVNPLGKNTIAETEWKTSSQTPGVMPGHEPIELEPCARQPLYWVFDSIDSLRLIGPIDTDLPERRNE